MTRWKLEASDRTIARPQRAAKAALICLVAVAMMGCASMLLSPEERALQKRSVKNEYPTNPVAGMKTVGLYVIDACATYHPDIAQLSSILHTELQSVEGLEVLPDLAVALTVDKDRLILPRDGLDLADRLQADGIFVAAVTDYNPYGEPVIAMGLILFSRKTAHVGALDIDKVIQGGTPLAMPDSPATKPVTSVFDVYDAAQRTTRKRIELYAQGQTASSVGMGWERYYRTMPNFMKFASYEIVWKLFTELRASNETLAQP